MFRLTKSSSGYPKNHEVLYSVVARIWHPRWLTIFAGDPYHVPNLIYIYYTTVIILGANMGSHMRATTL